MTQQQFRPGDLVMAEVTMGEQYDDDRVIIKFGSTSTTYATIVEIGTIHPLPTPAQQLRAAAEMCSSFPADLLHPNEMEQCTLIVRGLNRLAGYLEASSAPKPPTLREAAKAYVARMDADNLCALMAAINREEGTTDA